MALLLNIRDNAINSLIAFNQINPNFREYTRMFNERRSKVDMNYDVLCNRIIIGLANVALKTHAMSYCAESVTPLTIVELQKFLSRLVVDYPHIGRVDR
jgi:hypothetical protein